MGEIGELAASIRCALCRAEPKMPSYPVGVVEPYLKVALDEGRADERRAVVEWLRSGAGNFAACGFGPDVAEAIERGEHHG